MAVSVDATGTGSVQGGGTSTGFNYTNLTTTASANAIIVGLNIGSGASAIVVKWGAQTMTQVATILNSVRTSVYGLISPSTSGNQTVSGTWTGTAQFCVDAISFAGVDTSSFGNAFTFATNSGAGTSSTATVASQASAQVFGIFGANNNFTGITGTHLVINNSNVGTAMAYGTGVASSTFTGTLLSGTWGGVAVSINAPVISASTLGRFWYTTEPTDDTVWSSAPNLNYRSSAPIQILTSQHFFGAGGQVPTKNWAPQYTYDVAEPNNWYPTLENLNSSVLPSLTYQKFFGAGGQVPTKRWSPYITPDDSSPWYPTPENLDADALQLLTAVKFFGAPGQAPTKRWLPHYNYDDSSHWLIPTQNMTGANGTIILPKGNPFQPPPRSIYNYDVAEIGWYGNSENYNSTILQNLSSQKFFGAGGQVPTKRWLPQYTLDDPPTWYPPTETLTASTLEILVAGVKFFGAPGQAPTKNWVTYILQDDPPAWQVAFIRNQELFTPAAAAVTNLLPTFTVPNPPFDTEWVGKSTARNLDISIVAEPFFNPQAYNYDVAEIGWYGNSENYNSTILQNLTAQKFFGAGGQAPTKFWSPQYTIDDPPTWYPTADSFNAGTLDLLAHTSFFGAPGQVPTYRWRYDTFDDPTWQQASIIGSATFYTLLTAANNPFKPPPWKQHYDVGESSVWYGLSENNNATILQNFTAQKFFGAGGQVPTKFWPLYYSYDVGESFWNTPPKSAAIIYNLTQQKFFGVGGEVPTRVWRFGYNDDSTWQVAFIRNQELFTPAAAAVTNLLPTFTVPNPPFDTEWVGTPVASTNLEFLTAPIILPIAAFWVPYTDSGEAIWNATSLTRNPNLVSITEPFFNPPFNWKYSFDDFSNWQGKPTPSALLVPELTASGLVKFQREWLFGYEDPSGWQYLESVLIRNLSIDTITQTPITVNVPPWRFTYDDPPYWVGAPERSAAIPLLTQQKVFGTGGQVPTERWAPFYNYDDSSGWSFGPKSSTILIPQLTSGPVKLQREWLFGYDDPAFWQILLQRNPQLFAPIITLPFAFLQARFNSYDDPPSWAAKPLPSTLLTPLTAAQVKWQREWLFGYDDPAYWQPGTAPRGSQLLIPQLSFGPVKFQRQWLFGYDDPAYWQYGTTPLSSRLLIPQLSSGPVKFEREWLFGYDDPAFWLGHPIGLNTSLTQGVIQSAEGFIYIPWKFGQDDFSFWVGRPIKSGTLGWTPLIFDPRFIASPNRPLPTNTGAARIQLVNPFGITRNFVTNPLRGQVNPNAVLLSNRGAARTLVTTPVSRFPSMPYGNDLSVIDPTVEKVTLTFNFDPWLAPGVTVTSVVSITATTAAVSQSTDGNPQAIVFGIAQIVASPTTGAANRAVLQQVSSCLPNVTYLLQCLVDTSDSQQLNLATHLPCGMLQ